MEFMRRMRPHALKIYQEIFPDCVVENLRRDSFSDHPQDDPEVHILDQHFAIDSLLRLPDGSFFTLQEKYRRNAELKWSDFTQEHKNAYGTSFEAPGEWFHLAAQLYFYGWANADETDFEEYVLIDIARYKLLVFGAGGLDKIGQFRHNQKHGRASFYGICLSKLHAAIISKKLSPDHIARIARDMMYHGQTKDERNAVVQSLNRKNRWDGDSHNK